MSSDPYARHAGQFRDPPRQFLTTLKFLGPGLILVGSIVGSGELIMTTKLGAQAGFVLLWFVLLSCVIKSVVQAELARYVISSGETFLVIFNKLPGPSGRRPLWLSIEWLVTVVASSLLGLGYWTWAAAQAKRDEVALGTGPAVAAAVGVLAAWVVSAVLIARRKRTTTSQGTTRPRLGWFLWVWMGCQLVMFINGGAILGAAGQALTMGFQNVFPDIGSRTWTVVVATVCGSLLLAGRYKMLERVSLGLVSTFTVITLVCTALLQWTDNAITFADVRAGLDFRIPTLLFDSGMAESGQIPVTMLGLGVTGVGVILTALAMYAGTGIGTWEMMHYTYWCVEKGYARHTGENEPGEAWPQRARGWIRVMYLDVGLTMIVFTVSTICFYFLGAAILYPTRDPVGPQTIEVLSNIFTGSLGEWAATLFVVGAFMVLFSTTFSALAGTSRLVADLLCVIGIFPAGDYHARLRFIRIYIVFGLVVNTITYCLFTNPPLMLMIASLVAVVLYPPLGLGTLWLRYRGVDPRIRPGALANVLLWISALVLALISPAVILWVLAIKQGWI